LAVTEPLLALDGTRDGECSGADSTANRTLSRARPDAGQHVGVESMTNNSSSSQEASDLARRRGELLASRKAAGLVIDVENCKVWCTHCNISDPYGVDPDPDLGRIGKVIFVRSAESDGPVCDADLPEDKYRALCDRIKRAEQTPTTAEGVRDVLLEEYARAVAALDEVIDDLVDRRFLNVPLDIVRCGVRLAFAELGKKGTPQHERLERKFRAELAIEGCNESSS
jgi:hypothetical protein